MAALLRAFAASLLLALPAGAQDLPPGVLELARMKKHVREELDRLRNCACLQTVVRRERQPGKVMKAVDTFRVEMLYTGDRERYTATGGRGYSDQHPAAFASGRGTMESAQFDLGLQTLFGTTETLFQYRGEEDVGGRRVLRYDFGLSAFGSGFTLEFREGRGKVGLRGTLWADRESLDPVRVDFHADEIPPDLPILTAEWTATYARVQMDGESRLLTQSSELHFVRTNGAESRHMTEFTHCRPYKAESIALPGGDALAAAALPPGAEPAPADGGPVQALPPGLTLVVRLTSGIGEGARVGNPLKATVVSATRAKGSAPIPAGAVVRGRIRRLDRTGDGYTVALEFTEIEASGVRLPFYAELQAVEVGPGLERVLTELFGIAELRVHGPG
ncbi:MAG TPA: hypothetical protein VGF59_28845, partial [Bryobacteraceae bacterium]